MVLHCELIDPHKELRLDQFPVWCIKHVFLYHGWCDVLLNRWLDTLPEPVRGEMTALYQEMEARQTPEAKLYKALDKLEAVIQHNESPLDTWLPLEYELNLTYADENVAFSSYLTSLRAMIREDTERKIAEGH